MIVTVTMNPAIDKTVDITRLEKGDLNRIKRVEMDAGGKGVNVSKTIRALGGDSIATGFIGGNSGIIIKNVLSELGITTDFVMVEGETRTNLKVVEEKGDVTELNEPGPQVSAGQLEELICRLEGYAAKDTLFVLAGSIPAGVPRMFTVRLQSVCTKREPRCFWMRMGSCFPSPLRLRRICLNLTVWSWSGILRWITGHRKRNWQGWDNG